MARTKEAIRKDLQNLEKNFQKEFAGHSVGHLAAEVFEGMLKERQRKYIAGMFDLYQGADLALALEVTAEKLGESVYVPAEEVEQHPFELSMAERKKVITRKKAKGKGK